VTYRKNVPTAMHVEFAFFRGDDVLHRGGLHVTADKGVSCFGEHSHRILSEVPSLEVQLYSGLVVEHEFDFPASSLHLRYCSLTPDFRQVVELDAALEMGVHSSEDWESITWQQFTLAFRCTPL
jgi:hypothetical protein